MSGPTIAGRPGTKRRYHTLSGRVRQAVSALFIGGVSCPIGRTCRPAEPSRADSAGADRLIFGLMQSLWSLINTRALSVSVAHDAFSFEISWFGILLIVGAMLLWRHLRR